MSKDRRSQYGKVSRRQDATADWLQRKDHRGKRGSRHFTTVTQRSASSQERDKGPHNLRMSYHSSGGLGLCLYERLGSQIQ